VPYSAILIHIILIDTQPYLAVLGPYWIYFVMMAHTVSYLAIFDYTRPYLSIFDDVKFNKFLWLCYLANLFIFVLFYFRHYFYHLNYVI